MSRWTLAAVAVSLVPGVVAWLSGRRVRRLLADPVLPERLFERTRMLAWLAAAAGCALIVAWRDEAWWAVPLMLLALAIGGFPARRAVMEEQWGVGRYLVSMGRFWTAFVGFWLALAATPIFLLEVDPDRRWLVAGILTVVFLMWHERSTDVFVALVGCRRFAMPPAFAPVIERAGIPTPQLFRFGFPGGRLVNAFAFPSTRRPTVLFSDTLVERFDADEQAAIFAHEVAHLEHFNARRLRWHRLFAWLGIGLMTLALPHFLAQVPLDRSLFGWAFVGAILGAVLLRGARHRAHEAESDRRAAVLCGDAEALIRALAKLTLLGRLPRRWGVEVERAASHPSLARRIQAIRGGVRPPLAASVVLAGATPGSWVLFEADRASWLEGVPPDTPREPGALREAAVQYRAVRYGDLVDLRLRAPLAGTITLVATDKARTTWTTPLRAGESAAAQAVLDLVDVGLAPVPAGRTSLSAVGRVFAALTILAAVTTTALGSVIVAGLLALARPSRAVCAALGAIALGGGLLHLARLEFTADEAYSVGAAVALAALGTVVLWLAFRRAAADAPGGALVPAIAFGIVTIGAWGGLLWAATLGPRALPLAEVARSTPLAALAPLGLAAALLTVRANAARLGAVAATAVAIVPLATATGWLGDPLGAVASTPSEIEWIDEDPRIVSRGHVDGFGVTLRTSPAGSRFAVRLAERGAVKGPTFRVMTAFGGDRRDLAAEDLVFLGDSRVLTVGPTDQGPELRLVDLAADGEPVWRLPMAALGEPRIAVAGETGDFSVVGVDAEGEYGVLVFGRLGRDAVETRRWPLRDGPTGYGTLFATSGAAALGVRTRAAGPAASALALVLPVSPVVSELWRVGSQGERQLAQWAVMLQCLPPAIPDGIGLCSTLDRGRSLLWLVDPGADTITPLPVMPRVVRAAGGRGGVVAVSNVDGDVAVIDTRQQRGVRLTLPAAPLDLIPLPGRLAVLTSGTQGSTVSVYDLR